MSTARSLRRPKDSSWRMLAGHIQFVGDIIQFHRIASTYANLIAKTFFSLIEKAQGNIHIIGERTIFPVGLIVLNFLCENVAEGLV